MHTNVLYLYKQFFNELGKEKGKEKREKFICPKAKTKHGFALRLQKGLVMSWYDFK